MTSLPPAFRVLVFGASGALGGAFVAALGATRSCAEVIGLSRRSIPAFDLEDEASMRDCAAALAPRAPFHLMIDATGALTIDGVGPEKRLDDLGAARLARAFAVNAIGPALLLKHFVPLLPTGERCIFATLSARVGSIGDNRKGGWYGYRASKAALNMLLRTAAIEACRRRPEAVFAALQPGTVRSALSAPFVAGDDALAPEASAAMLLAVLDAAPARKEALFLDHRGHAIEW
jgi:NAD(P)-dependent dehydrogenase (short-subunit alcohol dehydrogenase family)